MTRDIKLFKISDAQRLLMIFMMNANQFFRGVADKEFTKSLDIYPHTHIFIYLSVVGYLELITH